MNFGPNVIFLSEHDLGSLILVQGHHKKSGNQSCVSFGEKCRLRKLPGRVPGKTRQTLCHWGRETATLKARCDCFVGELLGRVLGSRLGRLGKQLIA